MMWLVFASVLIAVLRLFVIILGLSISLQLICNRLQNACCSQQSRRKYFFCANLIYLLGLIPHSLLLFLATFLSTEDTGFQSRCSLLHEEQESTICWTQRLFCAIASAVHLLQYLSRVSEFKTNGSDLCSSQKRNSLWNIAALSYSLFATCQSLSLWPRMYAIHWTYENFQEETWSSKCAQFSEVVGTWFKFLVKNDRQTVQIQLLLCEERLYPSSVIVYLACCSVVGLPILMYATSVRLLLPYLRSKFGLQQNTYTEVLGCSCCQDDPHLDGAMSLLSLIISWWISLFRPVLVSLFSTFSEYFLDLGTHALLTLCVLVPITVRSTESSRKETNDGVCGL